MDDSIKEAIDSELQRQGASPEERRELEPTIIRAQENKRLSHGEETALWSVPLAVENSLSRHRERVALAKNNPTL
jgi:hypothetical protein